MIYWLVALALIFLSYPTGFSIGPFLFLVGLAMLVLGPFRHRPSIYWPPMAAMLAFLGGYLAVEPLFCSATTSDVGTSTTSTASCSSVIGITYAGTNAPRLPGVYAGVVLALITAVVVVSVIWWRGRLRRASAI